MFNSEQKNEGSVAVIVSLIVAFLALAAVVFLVAENKYQREELKELKSLDEVGVSVLDETKTKVDNENSQQNQEGALYSKLGFSVFLPLGVTAGNVQQAEGGPYSYVTFSDGTNIRLTTNFEFDDKFGDFPAGGLKATVGDMPFSDISVKKGISYGVEVDGKRRYQFYQHGDSKIDLSTFKILADLVSGSSVSTALPQYIGGQQGWPPVVYTSLASYSCNTGPISELENASEKTINGRTYCVNVMREGAAGSIFKTYTYTIANGSGTKTTTFTLRYLGCGGYGGPGDLEYDQCQTTQSTFDANLDALIDSLM